MKHVFTLFAFALMSSASAQVSNHVSEDGLRYWSDFDGSVVDQSMHQTSTSLFGAVPTVDRNGTAEGAMFFDGVDDHVKLFEVEGGVTFEDELTVAAWMKADEFLGVHHPRLFHSSEGVGGGFDRWFFTWSPASAGSVVGFGVGNGQNSTVGVDSQNSLTPGEWHHVAAIFHGGLVKVLVDGVLESEAPLTFTSLNHINAPVFLGSALGNSHFNGALDEVGIWDRALSVEEVLNLYLMSSGDAQLPDYVPSDGLVAWYPFTGDASDLSEFGNDGSVQGPSLSTDRFGNESCAYGFDGVDDYILIEESDALEFENGDFTFSGWFQTSVSKRQWVVSNYLTYGNNPLWMLGVPHNGAPSSIGIDVRDGINQIGESVTNSDVVDGSWHHSVFVRSGENIELYLDGVSIYSLEVSNLSRLTEGNPYYIGTDNLNFQCWEGAIDDVGFWNRSLTESEILGLYLSESAVQGCTDLLSCNFNEAANEDDGSCDYSCCPGPGCCDVGMHWDWELGMCQITNVADTNLDGCVQLNDLLDVLSAYGNCAADELVWQCGDPHEYQGYDYETVQIGEQCWFAENLRSEKYENGEVITADLNDEDWANSTFGAVSFFDNSLDSLAVYGRLYNWYAVIDSRGLCPNGWHVPTDDEWKDLEMHLGMSVEEVDGVNWRGSDQGIQLKSSDGWREDGDGTNTTGFTALPGGWRTPGGAFVDTYGNGYWWSSSASNSEAWSRHLDWIDTGVYRKTHSKHRGESVRCIQDTE